jgi:hypothetical protein
VKDRAASKKKALDFILKKEGPVLVGEIALLLGQFCSLTDAESLLTELAEEGHIRRLSPNELEKIGRRLAYIGVKYHL